MEYRHNIRRIIRKEKYENWVLESSLNDSECIYDYVWIFFDGNDCEVFLFYENDELIKSEDYILILEGIYHDVGITENDEIKCDLKLVKIPSDIQNDDSKIDLYIQNIIRGNIEKYSK